MFEITQSADIIVVTTETAFLSADLVTSTGSIIPDLIISTASPVITLIPVPSIIFTFVTKSALKNAISVVSTIISADCVISNMRMNESN